VQDFSGHFASYPFHPHLTQFLGLGHQRLGRAEGPTQFGRVRRESSGSAKLELDAGKLRQSYHACQHVTPHVTLNRVIRSFRHKGLRRLFETGQSPKVASEMQARCLRLLDVLNGATVPDDMNLPGFYFHKLKGKPERYSVRVTGNWRLTFRWGDGDALDVNLEDYH